MTMLSFRAEEALAEELDRAARASGTTRSALLNRALREMLYRLACERDAEAYDRQPLRLDELVPTTSQAWPKADHEAW
jgi:predicted transcriptional regulator